MTFYGLASDGLDTLEMKRCLAQYIGISKKIQDKFLPKRWYCLCLYVVPTLQWVFFLFLYFNGPIHQVRFSGVISFLITYNFPIKKHGGEREQFIETNIFWEIRFADGLMGGLCMYSKNQKDYDICTTEVPLQQAIMGCSYLWSIQICGLAWGHFLCSELAGRFCWGRRNTIE